MMSVEAIAQHIESAPQHHNPPEEEKSCARGLSRRAVSYDVIESSS